MAEEKSSKKGCMFWGCIITAVLAVVIVIGVIATVKVAYDKITSFMADEPAEIQVYEATEEEQQIARDKVESLKNALDTGEAETVTFTADDLNTLIATHEDFAMLKSRVFLTIEDNEISAEGSFPLDQFGFEGKYLHGQVDVEVKVEDGDTKVYIKDVMVKDEPLPEQFMQSIRQTNVMDEMRNHQDPQVRETARQFEEKVESIDIRDGKIIIKVREQAGASGDGESQEAAPEAEAPMDEPAPVEEPGEPAPEAEEAAAPGA